jgi:hypothetical protein
MQAAMKHVKPLLVLLCLSLCGFFLNSCKNETENPDTQTFAQYYPLAVGQYRIYQCDSLFYNDFTGQTDTFRFWIKERLESAFTDNSGQTAYRIERYKRVYGSSAWTLNDVWMCSRTPFTAEKVEEDQRLVLLRFPLKDDLKWNRNALNNLGESEVKASNLHSTWNENYTAFDGTTLNLNYDSTVTVINTDPTNLINEYRNTEVFAAGVGMIYRNLTDVEYVTPPATGIKSGVVFTMILTEFGQE